MNILFIDTESFPSHINFNRIHISKLLEEGHHVSCIFRIGYFQKLGIENISMIHEIPNKYYKKGNDTRIIGRIFYLRRLLNIRKYIKSKKYDIIINSYYDETVLPFAFFHRGLYLINHINIGGLRYKLKLFFFKLVSKRNQQIVLTKDSQEYLNSMGLKSIYVRHGIPDVYPVNLPRPVWMKFKYSIFSPSATSSDEKFLTSLISSKEFVSYLERNDILFIIRSNQLSSTCKNILIIDYFMSNEEYMACFTQSDIIFVCYKPTFRYRASGILWECIANSKNVAIRNIPGMTEYKEIFDISSFFYNEQDLLNTINTILNCSYTLSINKNIDLSPNYKFLENMKNQ